MMGEANGPMPYLKHALVAGCDSAQRGELAFREGACAPHVITNPQALVFEDEGLSHPWSVLNASIPSFDPGMTS